MRRLRGVVLALGVGGAADVGAQAAQDSASFRAGQWGNEFAVSSGFSSVSLLKFRSPQRAWLLDLGGSVSSSSGREQEIDRDGSSGYIRLQLGHRWYKALAPRLYQHVSLGALGSYGRSSTDYTSGLKIESTGTGVGMFGALGANWMVTPHLSLGAAWQVTAERNTSRQTRTGQQPPPGTPCPIVVCDPQRQTTTDTRLGFGDVSLRLALYY